MAASRTLPESTLDGTTRGRSSWADWGRRGFLVALALVVAAGAAGLLGVRDETTAASGGGYELSVRHASVARAGLDVPLEITVHHPGGFGDEIRLRVTGDYIDLFETQGFTPDPTEATRDGSDLTLTFAAPEGDVFRVAYDAYVQPAAQRGGAARVSLLVGGDAVASVDLTTRVLP